MNHTVLITIGVAIIAFVGIYMVALQLAKHKVNTTETLEVIGTGITYAQSISQAISHYLPDTADNVIKFVLDTAQKAVTNVEATYKAAIATGAGANDQRAEAANSLIKSALALEGIEDTAQIDKLIGAIIPVIVLALPKTHEDAAPVIAAPVADTATV